jgi:hypothetical protein
MLGQQLLFLYPSTLRMPTNQQERPTKEELSDRLGTVATELSSRTDSYSDRVENVAALKRHYSEHNPATPPIDSLWNIHIEHALLRYGLSGEECYDTVAEQLTHGEITGFTEALETFLAVHFETAQSNKGRTN